MFRPLELLPTATEKDETIPHSTNLIFEMHPHTEDGKMRLVVEVVHSSLPPPPVGTRPIWVKKKRPSSESHQATPHQHGQYPLDGVGSKKNEDLNYRELVSYKNLVRRVLFGSKH